MSVNMTLTELIAKCHQSLDEIFLLHQEAVLLGRFDDAIQLLDFYRELHRLHMDFEDGQLIPRHHELDIQGQWPASLYTDEHTKIQKLMGLIEVDLLSLSDGRLSDQKLRRGIIAFLDKQKTFKGLSEHHQEREEKGLLPELDKQTEPKWRANVIEPFLHEWNGCLQDRTNIAVQKYFPLPDRAGNPPFFAIMADQVFINTTDAPEEE
jgi:hemerythrin-like domain-containing protein